MAELGTNPLAAGEHNIAVHDAVAQIAAALAAHPAALDTEEVGLLDAVGRILAADVISPIDVPAHDNSAMDGYAFAGIALQADADTVLRAVGTVYAGQAPLTGVGGTDCVRIMTGAVLPPGLDTVVPLELCTVEGDQVRVKPGVIRPGENRRRRGEDLAQGRPALTAGRVLRAGDIGLVASLGSTGVTVRRRLRVAVFSTGDEVVAPGQPLPENAIYDSNRYALLAALQRLGMQALDLGLLRDDPATLEAALRRATREADAIVTSGGVSAGDADHTREVMGRLGAVDFWKVAMRPGRPFAFGSLDRDGGGPPVWLFALPGNPVAALVTFYVFARDALLALAGAAVEPRVVLQARSAEGFRKRPGRTEFQRGVVERAADGTWQARTVGSQGAGVLRSMSEANALIVLRHDQGSVKPGDPVDVWPFEGLV